MSKGAATDRPSLFSGPYYLAEQLGFRKIIHTTFMIAPMIHGDPDLKTCANSSAPYAPRDTTFGLRTDSYTHYYKNEFPERFLPQMDTHRWGPSERPAFEPYTKKAHAQTFDWITRHGIFAEGGMGHGRYEDSVLSLIAAGSAI